MKQEYPKMLYKEGGKDLFFEGLHFHILIVSCKSEQEKAISEGFTLKPIKAVIEEQPVIKEEKPKRGRPPKTKDE